MELSAHDYIRRRTYCFVYLLRLLFTFVLYTFMVEDEGVISAHYFLISSCLDSGISFLPPLPRHIASHHGRRSQYSRFGGIIVDGVDMGFRGLLSGEILLRNGSIVGVLPHISYSGLVLHTVGGGAELIISRAKQGRRTSEKGAAEAAVAVWIVQWIPQ